MRTAVQLPHGNVYVNRNMIGAVAANQPFDGNTILLTDDEE
jgi:delta 1-pyrroline-5-carboxylate dehydrogenase